MSLSGMSTSITLPGWPHADEPSSLVRLLG